MSRQFQEDDQDVYDRPEDQLQNELETIPFGVLLKAKRRVEKHTIDDDRNTPVTKKRKIDGDFRHSRLNKHAPKEVSAKKAVSRARTVVEPDSKLVAHDPRFNPLSGQLDDRRFRLSYGFLSDKKREELAELRKALKTRQNLDENSQQQLRAKMSKIQNEINREDSDVRKEAVMLEWKRKEKKSRLDEGKRPFYLKKKTLRDMVSKDRLESMSKQQLFKADQRKVKREKRKDMKGKVPWKATVT